MTLFSCWRQSDRKKSFMTYLPRARATSVPYGGPIRKTVARRCTDQPQLKLKDSEFFLLFELLRSGGLGGGLDRLGLVGGGAGIEGGRVYICVGVRAQLL